MKWIDFTPMNRGSSRSMLDHEDRKVYIAACSMRHMRFNSCNARRMDAPASQRASQPVGHLHTSIFPDIHTRTQAMCYGRNEHTSESA
jgi:hypothetical protein